MITNFCRDISIHCWYVFFPHNNSTLSAGDGNMMLQLVWGALFDAASLRSR